MGLFHLLSFRSGDPPAAAPICYHLSQAWPGAARLFVINSLTPLNMITDLKGRVNNQDILIELSQDAAFVLCCFELGQFYRTDIPIERNILHMDNVCALRLILTPDQDAEFKQVFKNFDTPEKRELIKSKGVKIFNATLQKFENLLK